MSIPDHFRALIISEPKDGGQATAKLSTIPRESLPTQGEVLVQVFYSSLNYKDALAVTGRGKIVRSFPMVPGIDLAGIVINSSDSRFKRGDPVIATGWGLGERYWGGLAEYASVKAENNLPVKKNNSAAQATPAQTPAPYGTIVWGDWHHYKHYPTQWYGTYRAIIGTSNLGNGSYKHYLRVELENTNAWVSFSNLSCNGQVILSIIGLPAGCDLGGGGVADLSGTTFEAEDTLDDGQWNFNAFIKAD